VSIVLALLHAAPLALAEEPTPIAPAAIINGADATLDDYPMTGGLIFQGDISSPFGSGRARSFACSSTLIAPDTVLLAAHCVDPEVLSGGFGGSAENLEFRWSREVDLSGMDNAAAPWPEHAIPAHTAIFHEQWSMNNLEDLSLGDPKYDIALLFLDAVITDTPYAIVVTAEEDAAVETGAPVDIVGWGMQEPIGLMDSFLPPEPGTFGIKQIGASVIDEVGTYEFQVGAQPSDVRKCKGDSGGPTFMEVDSRASTTTRIVGVTSRAADNSLCETKGGFDTRLGAYLDWIDTTMAAACDDGSRLWCDTPGLVTPELHDELTGETGRFACGCASGATGAGAAWAPALLALLAIRRRISPR
jgi:hypothetical protein